MLFKASRSKTLKQELWKDEGSPANRVESNDINTESCSPPFLDDIKSKASWQISSEITSR